MSLTMVCGLATETWSRPAPRDADGYRGWVGDPPRDERIMMLERKRRAYKERNYQLRPEQPTVFPYDGTIQVLSSRERYEYENQPVPPMPSPLTYEERRMLRDYARAYTLNFVYRMIPHTVGWFPYMACWIVYANEFLTSLDDLKKEDEDLYDSIPAWVPYAVFGTFLFFTSFTFVQWRYQLRSSLQPTVWHHTHSSLPRSGTSRPTSTGRPSSGTASSRSRASSSSVACSS